VRTAGMCGADFLPRSVMHICHLGKGHEGKHRCGLQKQNYPLRCSTTWADHKEQREPRPRLPVYTP
jgi:hypothetical protein